MQRERASGVSLPPPLVSFALKCQLKQGGKRVSLLLVFIYLFLLGALLSYYFGCRLSDTYVGVPRVRGACYIGRASAGAELPGFSHAILKRVSCRVAVWCLPSLLLGEVGEEDFLLRYCTALALPGGVTASCAPSSELPGCEGCTGEARPEFGEVLYKTCP